MVNRSVSLAFQLLDASFARGIYRENEKNPASAGKFLNSSYTWNWNQKILPCCKIISKQWKKIDLSANKVRKVISNAGALYYFPRPLLNSRRVMNVRTSSLKRVLEHFARMKKRSEKSSKMWKIWSKSTSNFITLRPEETWKQTAGGEKKEGQSQGRGKWKDVS